MKKIIVLLPLLFLMGFSCKKKKADPHVPPDVEFKTGGNYVSGDKAIAKGDTILVGIIATKTEDDLKSYNVSFYYDGNTSGTTFHNYLMTSGEAESFSQDIRIGARNTAGNERWVFSIVDRDGNITQKTIVLTVN
jgi:hypothetical protein